MANADDLNHPLPWPETLDRLRDYQRRLLMAILGIPERDLARPERAAEGGGAPRWSILNVISHLGDLELVTAVRLRSILAGAQGALTSLDQERFVATLPVPLEEVLEQFGFHRRMNLALVERLPDVELAREGEHPEFGILNMRQIMARVQRHQERHLRQIETIKSALGLDASKTFDVTGVVVAHPDTSPVRDIGPGIRVRDLWRSRVRSAMQVEIDAGAEWPGIDYHVPGPEEVYVVSGEFDDGTRVYPEGSFLHHPAGSSHVPRSREGCTLFVFYPEG
jgi:quercetin dioxygenase-like cupin family protein